MALNIPLCIIGWLSKIKACTEQYIIPSRQEILIGLRKIKPKILLKTLLLSFYGHISEKYFSLHHF